MEDVVASMQRKHRNEVSELQATVDRLVKVALSHSVCLVYDVDIIMTSTTDEVV